MGLGLGGWLWHRLRPTEGWLPFWLLVGVVACLATAVLEARWVPDDDVVVLTAVLGLLLGVVLAKRPISPLFAWVLITVYCSLFTFFSLSRLFLPISLLLQGWQPVRQQWLQNGALFWDRATGWWQAISTGGTSRETIVFAFGLGVVMGLLAAYAGWSAFRQKRPLIGITLLGLALAINTYFGDAPIWWAAIFVALTGPLAAMVHYAALSQEWDETGVDYSAEIWLDLVGYAGAIGLSILMLSFTLPAINISQLTRAFQQQPAVQQTEQILERMFAGVQQPRRLETVTGPGGAGGGGIMPRTFLLGDAPQLYRTVVMTATVSTTEDLPDWTARHWRGLSYDVYTGRGWALSEEREQVIEADSVIPLPAIQSTAFIVQRVHWLYDRRVIRYTLGMPVQFDQPVTTFWRGAEDFVRVQGDGIAYQLVSQVAVATPNQLRNTAVSDIPSALLARYTQLPPIPQRVQDLARQAAGSYTNPYDQAYALEQFLRQYPYSLHVPLPPQDIDPVEYFLFELQQGYCDYYASAMVVMARSLGLPARLATGFVAQPPDAGGQQTIYQINSHSWAEVYFAGYGWVEFEPTAAFPSPFNTPDSSFSAYIPELTPQAEPFPIPPADPPRPFPWGRWAVVLALAVGIIAVWWYKTEKAPHDVVWVYGRLQAQARQLGQPTPPSQTPTEFLHQFTARLRQFGRHPRLKPLTEEVRPWVVHLTETFMRRQYANEPEADTAVITTWWQKIKRPLRWLRFYQRIGTARKS